MVITLRRNHDYIKSNHYICNYNSTVPLLQSDTYNECLGSTQVNKYCLTHHPTEENSSQINQLSRLLRKLMRYLFVILHFLEEMSTVISK